MDRAALASMFVPVRIEYPMKLHIPNLARCLLCFALHGVYPVNGEPVIMSGLTMGTAYHMKLIEVPDDDKASIQTEIDAVLADVDRRLSTYREDSEVSRFNRAPAGAWFEVSPATAEVATAALAISKQTNGALDVTVGPLVRLWHFGPQAISDIKQTADVAPPDEDLLREALNRVGYRKLEVRADPPAFRKPLNGIEIDLSAVGEGDAVDRLANMLTRRGIDNFLIELGGEVRTGGPGPDGRPWRVGVQRPIAKSLVNQVAVSLRNAALSTSGDYHRYFEHDGHHYPHIIDPSNGRPVTHTLASATVAADNCLTADGWATALMVLGPKRGYECAVEHGVAAVLISHNHADFTVQETPAWRNQFKEQER